MDGTENRLKTPPHRAAPARRLRRLQENWEGFAQIDPLWAICTDPLKRGNRWTQEKFFETGRLEIKRVLEYVQSKELFVDFTLPVLDFGCGVGRLTRALAHYFDECWGVDIAPTMIRLAQELNKDSPQCHFVLNQAVDLHGFPDRTFGFVYASIVFQHIEKRYVRLYLPELVRIVKPGGLIVFQIPDKDKTQILQRIRNFVGFRRRLFRALGRRSVDAFHMQMHCMEEREIRKLLSNHRARILDVKLTNSTAGAFNGDLQFLDQEPACGYVSKQYCVLRTE